MLLAALAFVVIAFCYDGDTCTTTSGERVRLACNTGWGTLKAVTTDP